MGRKLPVAKKVSQYGGTRKRGFPLSDKLVCDREPETFLESDLIFLDGAFSILVMLEEAHQWVPCEERHGPLA